MAIKHMHRYVCGIKSGQEMLGRHRRVCWALLWCRVARLWQKRLTRRAMHWRVCPAWNVYQEAGPSCLMPLYDHTTNQLGHLPTAFHLSKISTCPQWSIEAPRIITSSCMQWMDPDLSVPGCCCMTMMCSLNLVHCDVKPANVLLKSSLADIRGFTTKLSDFGLTRIRHQKVG